ncbi:MAG: dihydroorotase [Candidatus Obscuribacterales bacterium]|nr:dihydroorotase [Candidatus Obscuribacterales bacterium]
MQQSLFIKSVLVIDPANKKQEVMDVRINDGVIAACGTNIKTEDGDCQIDGKNLWLTPGFIDIHTHLRDLGQSDKEDIETGTKSAAAGGYTKVLAMANTDPPIDSPAILSILLKKIEDKACVKVYPVATVTKGMSGAELTSMVDLARMGVQAFSDDGMPVSNLGVLRRALEYAKLADRTIISHAEDHDLTAGGCMHEGPQATALGLPGIPYASEAACVAREIEVARQTGGKLHFGHISTAISVELIAQAKKQGVNVTADTTPHHLSLSADDIKEYDTCFKMNPPLRTEADQKALVAALVDGTLDAIATDHAPHTKLEKSLPFDKAPFGVIGLETALPLTLEKLVKTKKLTPLQFISLLTDKPSTIIGLSPYMIKPGEHADLVLLDPELSWQYDSNKGLSKSSNSPFHLRNMTGKVLLTIAQGKVAYQDEKNLSSRISGKLQTANK